MLGLGLLNFAVAIALFIEGQRGIAFAYFCYAISNAGLYVGTRG